MDDELRGAFDGVTWQVEPEAEQEARATPTLTAEVLFYAAREAVRNAARHGRDDGEESRPLHIQVSVRRRDGLEVTVCDLNASTGVFSTEPAMLNPAQLITASICPARRIRLSIPSPTERMSIALLAQVMDEPAQAEERQPHENQNHAKAQSEPDRQGQCAQQ